MDLLPVIDGVILLEKLGEGTFGSVYEAMNVSDGFKFAIKFIKLKDTSRNQKRALDREISVLAKMKEECTDNFIICYYDYAVKRGKDSDYAVISMEYIKGNSLGELFNHYTKNNKSFEKDHIFKIMKHLLSAIEYLQSRDIVHRDIKPDNIMFNTERLTLIDFGLACIFPDCNDLVGSRRYVSPELWDNSALKNGGNDKWLRNLDIYSLGKLFLQLTTMVPPPLGYNIDLILKMEEEYPENVATVIKLALSENPDERPDAKTLLKILNL